MRGASPFIRIKDYSHKGDSLYTLSPKATLARYCPMYWFHRFRPVFQSRLLLKAAITTGTCATAALPRNGYDLLTYAWILPRNIAEIHPIICLCFSASVNRIANT